MPSVEPWFQNANLKLLDLTNYFLFFHHLQVEVIFPDLTPTGTHVTSDDPKWPILKTEKRQNFDEILFTRIKNIVHLRVDHNMIDKKMILLIATHWNHCLKLVEIDCRYAYRNFQFSRGRHFTQGKRTKGFKTFEQSISGLNEFRVRSVRVHCIKWT